MLEQPDFKRYGCNECAKGCDLEFDFSMAFQPIVDVESRQVFAQEALVRGPEGQGAAEVFQHINDSNRYRFDQSCRVKAIKLASELNIDSFLSINFLPNAVYKPELCIRTTLAAADQYQFPIERIIFEFTEDERITDYQHLIDIIDHYRAQGFLTAIDDYGSGYNGLSLLSDIRNDIAKLDMALIRDINKDPTRQAIVRSSVSLFKELNMQVIAEGIESEAEYHTLRKLGIHLFQGYYFARPSFESLADIYWGD